MVTYRNQSETAQILANLYKEGNRMHGIFSSCPHTLSQSVHEGTVVTSQGCQTQYLKVKTFIDTYLDSQVT
jgi:hypothetical protein